MSTAGHENGRAAFADGLWTQAYDALTVELATGRGSPGDLERLAVAAHLIGEDDDSVAAWSRAYEGHLDDGDPAQAARCAFWCAWAFRSKGQDHQGAGWFARAQRVVEEIDGPCAEEGLLLVPVALGHLGSGQSEAALTTFREVIDIGNRFDDPDVGVFGRLGTGQALIRLGQTREGIAQLDDAMIAVSSGDVSPLVIGTVYCAVILECHATFDLARALEWTQVLSAWCSPDMIPFRGQCLVHRSELLQLRGSWQAAMDEADRACALLLRPPAQPAVGLAFYQRGELHRLRGEHAEAEEAYREANHWGRTPQPGLALLRLAQGRLDAAEPTIRRLVEQTQDPVERAQFLSANVEIMLAIDDVESARGAADELARLAVELDAPLLHARAAQADGAVRLEQGDASGALERLEAAATIWHDLDASYETAQVRTLVGRACHELGDVDTAELEWEAARQAFADLGATPDLARLEVLARPATQAPGGLTSREVEVLQQVAAGHTNREIAEKLVISEKTVERHLSNIFLKLDLRNRAAATAFAYEHDLV